MSHRHCVKFLFQLPQPLTTATGRHHIQRKENLFFCLPYPFSVLTQNSIMRFIDSQNKIKMEGGNIGKLWRFVEIKIGMSGGGGGLAPRNNSFDGMEEELPSRVARREWTAGSSKEKMEMAESDTGRTSLRQNGGRWKQGITELHITFETIGCWLLAGFFFLSNTTLFCH